MKVFTSGQKGHKLDKSCSSSANKGHKQLEDDVEVMERDVDMDERENSSNAESEESGAENMNDVSDADDNEDETDVDNEDDDDGPTDVEEPEIEDRGKTFNGKKGSKTGQAGRKSTDSKRKNYAEPELSSSKVDAINLSRKKQEELFQPCNWEVSKLIKTSEVDFSKWLETHSHREQYFVADDRVSKSL